MLRSLAIETSGRQGSIALAEEGAVVAEATFSHGLQHAAKLLPMIADLARERSWRAADIDHIYVSTGPGSFTGLRISATLAKTLAWTTGAKLIAVPSVRVLLENLPSGAIEAVIVLDAKRGQVFTARFGRSSAAGKWDEIEPAHLDTLAAILGRAGRPVHLIGEGIPFHRAAVSSAAGIIVTDETAWRARAAAVQTIGHAMAMRSEFTSAAALAPLYIRLPEAEEKRLAAEA